jgi:hypothetical protein
VRHRHRCGNGAFFREGSRLGGRSLGGRHHLGARRGLLAAALLHEPALFVLEGGGELLPDECRRGHVEGAEIRVDLLSKAVEQLEDQSALNLELFRQLINP